MPPFVENSTTILDVEVTNEKGNEACGISSEALNLKMYTDSLSLSLVTDSAVEDKRSAGVIDTKTV